MNPTLEPDFSRGLVATVTQDSRTGEVLMLAWVDEEAWQATLETGYAHYHSRERDRLWKKGEESGNIQRVVEIKVDCDRDAILYRVEPAGPACHTGERTCFYRSAWHTPGTPES